jgi:exonuclease SbcC
MNRIQEEKDAKAKIEALLSTYEKELGNLKDKLYFKKLIEKDLKPLKKYKEKKKFVEKELSDLLQKFSKKKVEELRKQLEIGKKSLIAVELRNSIKSTTSQIKEIQGEIKRLDFVHGKLDSVEKEYLAINKELVSAKNEYTGVKKLIEEKQKLLNEIEKKIKLIEKLEDELEKIRINIDMGICLRSALKETQITLREEFISAINESISELWSLLYPYSDYQDLTLEIDSGGDYVLKLKDQESRWVSVDGIVSGGERAIACLALRIAFAKVLSPNLGWLVLDEPTHNLDKNGLAKFGIALKNILSKLVDQVFLITHQEELERYIEDKCYLFEKKGCTEVSELNTTGYN